MNEKIAELRASAPLTLESIIKILDKWSGEKSLNPVVLGLPVEAGMRTPKQFEKKFYQKLM